MSEDSKDSGIGGGIAALAVGGGVGYAAANRASKGFVQKVLDGKAANASEDAKKAIKDIKSEVSDPIVKASESSYPDAFKTDKVHEAPKLPDGVKIEDIKKETAALKDLKFSGDGARHAKVTVGAELAENGGHIFEIEHAAKEGEAVTKSRVIVKGADADLIANPNKLLEGDVLKGHIAEVEKIGSPIFSDAKISHAELRQHATALKGVKADAVEGVTIRKITVPGAKEGASATDHFIAEIQHITPEVKEGDVVKQAREVTKRTVMLSGAPEGVTFPKDASHVVLDEAARAKFVENGLGKAVQQTENAVLKGTRGALEKGFAMKNMGATRMGAVALGAVGSAIVAKVAFDALFGAPKDNGYTSKIASERMAPSAGVAQGA